ncbi:MAG: hypothetical protein PF439_09015 [Helicobacteraceae bacterium]|jgi:hypothetical protein|nr:hypothetical protein [Helicobacteraceae bacterium]
MKYLIIFTLALQLLHAAPAFHGKRTYTQPDGSEVSYRLQGDEHLNWIESDDGEVLLFSKKAKRLEYAEIKDGTLKASGVPYSKTAAVSARAPSSATPSKVSKEELSILYKKRRDEHLSKMKSRHTEH